MKLILLFLTLTISNVITSSALSLEDIRGNYEIAVKDKNICLSMIQQLEKKQETNVHLAYLGAFQTIWANHVLNPVTKLSTFNKGKKNIDKAAKLSPNNVEVIFIRYSIQKNCPSFLGYHDHLKEDQSFLIKNRNTILPASLKKMVDKILKINK